MAKKKNDNIGATPRLTVTRTVAATKLERQIEKGRELSTRSVNSSGDLKAAQEDHSKWSEENTVMLTFLFSDKSIADNYNRGWAIFARGYQSLAEETREFREDVNREVGKLQSILANLDLVPGPLEAMTPSLSRNEPASIGRRIFIVHGHDEEARENVSRFIEKLGLQAVILHELPNAGRTIIEKFEDYSDVGFAVVLLTSDDIGASRGDPNVLRPRARQNVILELGYFLGKLGRERVCALFKGDIDIPSDYEGILYVKMDTSNAWTLALARELRHAGIDFDANKVF